MDAQNPRTTRDSATSNRPRSVDVLFVEHDETMARLTSKFLVDQGFEVTSVGTAREAFAVLDAKAFEMVLLNVLLPTDPAPGQASGVGPGGYEVCTAIRQKSDVPIIFISALQDEEHRLMGFDVGADDYIVKPFSPRELVSRMVALIRRARGQVGPVKRTLLVEDLVLEPTSLNAMRNGKALGLTSYEFLLLYALAERRGKVVTREQLLEAAGGTADQAFDRSIDVHMSRLRHKLGDDARNPVLLKTVRGAGYMLAFTNDAAD